MGAVQEGDSATHDGSTCVITDRSGVLVVERRVRLPVVAALYREATIALVLSLSSLGAAVGVWVHRRPHSAGHER